MQDYPAALLPPLNHRTLKVGGAHEDVAAGVDHHRQPAASEACASSDQLQEAVLLSAQALQQALVEEGPPGRLSSHAVSCRDLPERPAALTGRHTRHGVLVVDDCPAVWHQLAVFSSKCPVAQLQCPEAAQWRRFNQSDDGGDGLEVTSLLLLWCSLPSRITHPNIIA